jgi:hypothetical protein
MSHRLGTAFHWAALMILSLCSLLLFGQDNQKRTVTNPLLVNVTGCLKKNGETGGYYVTDYNGRMWTLTSKKVNLASQIFHTVSVSGHPSAGSKTQEGKSEPGQQPQGSSNLSLDVTELQMLSNSCTR